MCAGPDGLLHGNVTRKPVLCEDSPQRSISVLRMDFFSPFFFSFRPIIFVSSSRLNNSRPGGSWASLLMTAVSASNDRTVACFSPLLLFSI